MTTSARGPEKSAGLVQNAAAKRRHRRAAWIKEHPFNDLSGSIMVPTKSASGVSQALRRAPRAAGRVIVKLYRFGIAPLIGMNCRHLPTCSDYADEALARYGLWAGGWMTLARLARCHPWGTSGFDAVPAELLPQARWWRPWRYGHWTGAHIDPKTRLDR
jgi:uncharacterized protein